MIRLKIILILLFQTEELMVDFQPIQNDVGEIAMWCLKPWETDNHKSVQHFSISRCV